MSVSKTDKEYWIKKLQTAIDKKIKQISADVTPNPLDTAIKTAKIRILERYNLTKLYQEHAALSAEYKKLDEAKDKVYKQQSEVGNKIDSTLAGTQRGYYGGFEERLKVKIEEEYLVDLQKLGPAGKSIAELLEQKEGLEMQIMFAVSSKTLVELVKNLCTKLNIDLS
jgi:hypothetical protein